MSNELARMLALRRFLIALTAVNVLCVLVVFLGVPLKGASASGEQGILRGRGLQIVDAEGRIRAGITVLPADPSVSMPDGGTMSDTVIFRLIDPKGRPEVKMTASEDGAALLLMGRDDQTFVRLKGQGDHSSVELADKAGHLKTLEP
jgi:hypothetical protein